MALTCSNAIDMSRISRLQMDRMADEDEDPNLREGIKYPGKHDVMLGRGGESTYHCGNIAFRQLVEDHKTKYYTCPRAHKSRVVAEVVKKWRQLTPPGRFLTRTNPASGDKSPWHDVGDSRALKKASHSLRDSVRCFSVEKKQRAQAEQGQEEGPAISAAPQPETRKKMDRNFFMASTRVGNSTLLEMVAARKTKKIEAPAFEERPAKRQRVVCDARGEAQKGCRRRGDDDVPLTRGCCDEGQDFGRGSCDFRVREAVASIPSSVALQRPAPPTSLRGFEPSFVASQPKRQEPAPAPRLPSPCGSAGSADWFTPATEDLPVQAIFGLPTADVLVQEVVVSDSSNANSPEAAPSDDENSLGWFSEGEEDTGMASFTSAPLFNVDLGVHRPVAVPSQVSSGR